MNKSCTHCVLLFRWEGAAFPSSFSAIIELRWVWWDEYDLSLYSFDIRCLFIQFLLHPHLLIREKLRAYYNTSQCLQLLSHESGEAYENMSQLLLIRHCGRRGRVIFPDFWISCSNIWTISCWLRWEEIQQLRRIYRWLGMSCIWI